MTIANGNSQQGKLTINDRGQTLDPEADTGRKFIYTPFNRTVTLAHPDERFHGNIYKNTVDPDAGSYMKAINQGDVFTGAVMPGPNVMWYQAPRDHPDKDLVEQSLGHNNWTFSKVASEISVHDIDVPYIQKDLSFPDRPQKWVANRRPFIYYPEDNAIHIGPYGSHHGDISDTLEKEPDGGMRGFYTNDDRWGNWKNVEQAPVEWWRHLLTEDEKKLTGPAEEAVYKHLGISPPENDWKFSAFGYGDPEIVQHDFDPETEGSGVYDEFRRPFLYDGANNRVHVGPLNGLHVDLARVADIPYRNAGGILHDFSNTDPEQVVDYSGLPPQVTEAVERHFGINQDSKEFGKFTSAKHKLDWQPGTKGKGWVFDDGTVWHWPVSEEDGMRPYHMEVRDKAEAQGLKPMEVRDTSNPTPSMPENGWLRATGGFYITEDGEIVGQIPNVIAHHAMKADPRLRDATRDDQWSFQ